MRLLTWYLRFLTINQVMITSFALLNHIEKSKRWINRRVLVRDFYKQRSTGSDPFPGWFENLKNDPEMFFKYTRMNVSTFNFVLDKVKPFLPHKRASRDTVPPEERLLITLRYHFLN